MTQYEFRLSLRSNDPKVVFTGKYLNQFDDMRHRILSKMVDSEYVIALCSDPTKTNQEILLALIESLSNDAARMAYKVNYVMADRGVNITPDMLSNFGLLPAIQYSSIGNSNIVEAASQDGSGSVSAYPSVPSQSSVIADLQEISIVKKNEEEDEYDEEDEEDEDDDNDDDDEMSDEEYLASKQHLLSVETIK